MKVLICMCRPLTSNVLSMLPPAAAPLWDAITPRIVREVVHDDGYPVELLPAFWRFCSFTTEAWVETISLSFSSSHSSKAHCSRSLSTPRVFSTYLKTGFQALSMKTEGLNTYTR